MSALGQLWERSSAPSEASYPRSRAQAIHRAVFSLVLAHPEFSARQVATPLQIVLLVGVGLVASAAFAAWPVTSWRAAVACISIGFLISLALRTYLAAVGKTARHAILQPADGLLPIYTVLVPLYHEAAILPQLSAAMQELDYPKDRLDLKYVVEEDDTATREAVERLGLSEIIVVPPGGPKTKPKACNYALQFARGSHLVIYDAEDRPDPDQLRKAVAAFRTHPDIACFQARLVIANDAACWLTKMFALDYSLWFRALLPGLARMGAPIPLGGTSNHFRTDVLVQAGAWDPFNVTEDADLGYRLARLGKRVSMLDSNTREEAPIRFGTWLRQRTRWMKGYMQTVLVHTRHPVLLARGIGVRACLLMQAFLGGAIWSALVNPVLWVIFVVCGVDDGDAPDVFEVLARSSGLSLLAANGLLATMSMLDGGGRLKPKSLLAVVSYPIYWLLISLAAYRALWQLIRDPFRWEKTPHGGALI